MMQLFQNQQRLQQLSLEALIASCNRWKMPEPQTEGQYTGYAFHDLRNHYLYFLVLSYLSGNDVATLLMHPSLNRSVKATLWLAIIICGDAPLIKELAENIAAPTASTAIKYLAADPGINPQLTHLVNVANIEFVTFTVRPGLEHEWVTLGELEFYQKYLADGSNSHSTNSYRR